MGAERGQMLSHYRLVEKIGEGGMGVVWKAEDTVLTRTVAIKVLPADRALDEERRQMFLDEARMAASVSHGNIVQVHELGRENDLDFIVMEYVEGQPLNKLLRGRPVPPEKVADWGLQVAQGLARAHRKGLLHRDLKPANILITPDGEVKIVDFGLATLFSRLDSTVGDWASTLTAAPPGEKVTGIAGTLPYMSPEQVRGEKLDSRSDIFSFGAVLYEMTTGQRPFAGSTPSEVAQEILRSQPRPVHEIVPKVPLDLHRFIEKALAPRPEDRYQHMDDVAVDLKRFRKELESVSSPSYAVLQQVAPHRRWRLFLLGGAAVILVGGALLVLRPDRHAPGPDANSIAVLPFVNMSEDKANEYFSDGVSEELLNLLAKIPQLKVSARTSSFSFKGKEVEIPEIARQLHVANVLEGSVRKSGNQVRITAQLIHAEDGYHVWSQTWDRRLDDIFKIQEEIAADVVKALELTLMGAAPKARTTDPQAYAHYLQAIQLGRQHTAEGLEKSDALYRQVLMIDPRYAPAWIGLANNSLAEGEGLGLIPSDQGDSAAREATEKALAIDPDYAPAHVLLGKFAIRENDIAAAARHYERALMLDPTNLAVLSARVNLLLLLGRLDEVLVLREAIVRRDPVNHFAISSLATTQRYAGRFDEAIASYRTALSLSPGMGSNHAHLGHALLLKGDAAGALAEIEQETSEVWRMICRAMAYHALGRRADSDAALAAMIAKYEKDGAYNIAYAYAFRGEVDQAFAWLDKAVEYRDPGLNELVVDNLFARIHSDPRWLPFLRRIGRAPEQLAKIEFKVALPD